ncbi:unnamed protein product, partial [Larinioides sclopetarius]
IATLDKFVNKFGFHRYSVVSVIDLRCFDKLFSTAISYFVIICNFSIPRTWYSVVSAHDEFTKKAFDSKTFFSQYLLYSKDSNYLYF